MRGLSLPGGLSGSGLPGGQTACWAALTLALIAGTVVPREGRSGEPARAPDAHLVSGLFGTPPGSPRNPDVLVLTIGEDGSSGAAGLASRIVAAEGGPGANSASSAAGYGQFLRGTWLELFARAYPQLADKLSSDQILALREMKPLALELTTRYAQQNALSLGRAGLPATEASLSLAHAVGPGGAINILVSRPDEPVENVLSRDAIAANPFMREMTAGTLQRWATSRIRLPAEPVQPTRTAPRLEEELEPLKPAEDFRIDGQTKASQVLAENRDAIAALQNFLEAAARTGAGDRATLAPSTSAWLNSLGIDPTELLLARPAALQLFNENAVRLVRDTIRRLAGRPAYREYGSIESEAGAGRELRPIVIRDVASALLGKMRRENATILSIVRHRRSAGAGRPNVDGNTGQGRT